MEGPWVGVLRAWHRNWGGAKEASVTERREKNRRREKESAEAESVALTYMTTGGRAGGQHRMERKNKTHILVSGQPNNVDYFLKNKKLIL